MVAPIIERELLTRAWCFGHWAALEELVADGTADNELLTGVALARRGVDDPVRTMHQAQVVPQVVAKLSQVAERHEIPEPAATPALEQSVTHHARHRAIRRSVIRNLWPGGLHNSEALEPSRLPALRVRRNARIRSGVDQYPAGCENPVYLAEGIDHAL
jgi:hypothetical protein